jgi:hypothetical protein
MAWRLDQAPPMSLGGGSLWPRPCRPMSTSVREWQHGACARRQRDPGGPLTVEKAAEPHGLGMRKILFLFFCSVLSFRPPMRPSPWYSLPGYPARGCLGTRPASLPRPAGRPGPAARPAGRRSLTCARTLPGGLGQHTGARRGDDAAASQDDVCARKNGRWAPGS